MWMGSGDPHCGGNALQCGRVVMRSVDPPLLPVNTGIYVMLSLCQLPLFCVLRKGLTGTESRRRVAHDVV
jgi:hypothetical protein